MHLKRVGVRVENEMTLGNHCNFNMGSALYFISPRVVWDRLYQPNRTLRLFDPINGSLVGKSSSVAVDEFALPRKNSRNWFAVIKESWAFGCALIVVEI